MTVDVDRLARATADLHAQWLEQGAPIVQWLAPGISDAEQDELTTPRGFVLPDHPRGYVV